MMAADLNDETPQFLDVEYLGQHGGWHFYVAERPKDRALFTSASLPGGIYYGIAIPPIDGKPYPTVENINPPDPSMSVPTGNPAPGRLEQGGGDLQSGRGDATRSTERV